jgi:hypothetical protein
MFTVSEAEATAIRTAYTEGGELSAAVEVRRLFPGITDLAKARECARTIAGWQPASRWRTRRNPPLQPNGAGQNLLYETRMDFQTTVCRGLIELKKPLIGRARHVRRRLVPGYRQQQRVGLEPPERPARRQRPRLMLV